MSWIYGLDLLGVFVFAISGVLTAIDNKFDVVGAAIIGMVTAIGGGTLRDLLIGETPVGWMKDMNYLIVALVALIISYLFKKYIIQLKRSMFFFDTIGIGLFTILGIQKTMELGLDPIIALLMGVVTAVFGGVLRDVLTNVVPLIFRKEIYASACLAGGISFLILSRFSNHLNFNLVFTMLIVVVIRYLSVKFKLTLRKSTSED